MAHAMQRFYEVVAFLVGLNIGSFLNVVIARVPEGRSIVRPGSHCPRCQAPIRWHDNLPLLSWILLGAKCRDCRLPIPSRYPAVELLTGLLALAIAREYPPGAWAGLLFVFVCLLVAATYIDLDHWIIPHVLTWPGIVLGLVGGRFAPDHTVMDALYGAIGGFGIFALVGIVGARVFRKEALGQGDWWFLAMIGAFLGWKALLPVILLASLQGAFVGILLIVLGRGEKGRPSPGPEALAAGSDDSPAGGAAEPGGEDAHDEDDWVPPENAVPFGPFLALAALEQLFLGDALMDVYVAILSKLMG
jgi:leader peptidase (prepilin peptidase)/N-methyltransferase